MLLNKVDSMNFRLHKNCVCQKFIEKLNNLPEESPENA